MLGVSGAEVMTQVGLSHCTRPIVLQHQSKGQSTALGSAVVSRYINMETTHI